MRIAIIVNAERSNQNLIDQKMLDQYANQYHFTYDLFIEKPQSIEPLSQELIHQSYNAFLIAGGDGTVRAAAQVLVDQDVPLAILPLGTFNYFARELQFPNDIEAIFKMIVNGKRKLVDVGEVNDLIFINHSSIGFYSRILKLKQKNKEVLGKNKLLKILFTAFNLLKVIPIYQLELEVDKKSVVVNTCMIFIGNNYHLTNLLDFGERESLTSGKLAVYVLNCKTRWEVIKCIFSIIFNTFDKTKYLTQFSTEKLTILVDSTLINVVIDGDLFKLAPPLHYKINSKKLNVITP